MRHTPLADQAEHGTIGDPPHDLCIDHEHWRKLVDLLVSDLEALERSTSDFDPIHIISNFNHFKQLRYSIVDCEMAGAGVEHEDSRRVSTRLGLNPRLDQNHTFEILEGQRLRTIWKLAHHGAAAADGLGGGGEVGVSSRRVVEGAAVKRYLADVMLIGVERDSRGPGKSMDFTRRSSFGDPMGFTRRQIRDRCRGRSWPKEGEEPRRHGNVDWRRRDAMGAVRPITE